MGMINNVTLGMAANNQTGTKLTSSLLQTGARAKTGYSATNLISNSAANASATMVDISPKSSKIARGLNYANSLKDTLGLDDAKFMAGNVTSLSKSTLSSSNDKITFIVDPSYLSTLADDEGQQKDFTESVSFLYDASQKFAAQKKSEGYDLTQIWICDKDGNWSGIAIGRPTNKKSFTQEFTERILRINEKVAERRAENMEIIEKRKEKAAAEEAATDKTKDAEEADKAAASDDAEEAEETEDAEETTSSEGKSTVSVNESKRRRQIAAAVTSQQLSSVLSLLEEDLKECQNGVKNGWCDDAEVAKVEKLIRLAQSRQGQVSEEGTAADEFAFAMSGLM